MRGKRGGKGQNRRQAKSMEDAEEKEPHRQAMQKQDIMWKKGVCLFLIDFCDTILSTLLSIIVM